MVLWSYGFMVFNSSSGGLRVPGRRYSVVGRPTGPLDDGADSDGQPCGARSRRSRAMAATGAGAWIHGLMVLWFHGSCRDEEHEEQPSGAPAPARRRGATARDADSAPWLPLAPARSATRSSLRAPRSEDAVRAAFERSRGEGAARAAFGRPRRPPFSCPLWFISLAPPWRNEEQPPGAPERGRGPSSLRALPRRRCGASCLRAPPQAPLLVPIMVHFNSISVGSAGLRQCQFPRRPRSRDRTSTAPEDPAVPVAMPPRARCLTRPAPAVKAMPG